MDLTPSFLEDRAEAYPEIQPLSAVEREHVEMLPGMFADGEFGWRDPEWVVQWYYRRFLGSYPDAERRAAEDAYGQNSYEDVDEAIRGATAADSAIEKLECLTALDGVDVSMASAFLAFLHPERCIVCSEREWETLRAAGELDDPYPDPPAPEAYESYLATCRAVADRCDVSLWRLYRALWAAGDGLTAR